MSVQINRDHQYQPPCAHPVEVFGSIAGLVWETHGIWKHTGRRPAIADEHTDGASASSTKSSAALSERPDPRVLRRMELTGLGLLVVWASGLIIWGAIYPDPYANGWQLVLELAFIGGRAVNIAHGVSHGYSHAYLIFQCGLQDIVYTLLLYPWVVRAYFGVTKLGAVGRMFDSLRRAAERQKRFVEPFGAVGLWLFIFFPFWSTGVINGAALGFLLRMRVGVTLFVVFTAHLSSMFAMLFFFEAMRGPMESLGDGSMRNLPWMVLGILLTLILLQQIYVRFRSRPNDTKE